MNLLTYDYHSAFEPAVNHHSPLYPLEEDNEYNFDAQLSIVSTLKS
jgi:chitinase